MKGREGKDVPGVVSAHRCRSGCQGAGTELERPRWGRVAGVEPRPGLELGRVRGVEADIRAGATNQGDAGSTARWCRDKLYPAARETAPALWERGAGLADLWQAAAMGGGWWS